ncbi:MAG: GNAT family N-acetyltransferase [Egibacteraceae bacterium]
MEMLIVERMGPDAWERVCAIRMRALRDSPDAFWTTAAEEAAMTPGEWRRRLERSGAATFVAYRAGADVGLAAGAPHHQQEGDAGLYGMWVAPEARGIGAGVALISSVAQWARGAGYQSLRLDVGDANTPAVRLYERMGFMPTGVTATFPQPRAHITEHERLLDLSAALRRTVQVESGIPD